jgi:predicted deacetylase
MQLPQPAQYLLRIDDLCPTVHRERWRRLLELVREFGIKPILAVVPENHDSELAVSPADPQFWATMRAMECEGATIALHGFRHLCVHRDRGLLPLSGSGEFAGAPLERQGEWIHEGLAILRRERLHPRLWVAPRHNFDTNTLRALRSEGISYLSDGLMRGPFLRGGVVWIPQQLWSPAEMSAGLWTICVHPNTLDEKALKKLRTFLERNAVQFTTFERVVREFSPHQPDLLEVLRERIEVVRIRLRGRLRASGSAERIGGVPAGAPTDSRREPPSDREPAAG